MAEVEVMIKTLRRAAGRYVEVRTRCGAVFRVAWDHGRLWRPGQLLVLDASAAAQLRRKEKPT